MSGHLGARGVLPGVEEGKDLVLGDGGEERTVVRPLEGVGSVREIRESSGALLVLDIPNSHGLVEARGGEGVVG